MSSHSLLRRLALAVLLPGAAAGQSNQPAHALIMCADSIPQGVRPANRNCAVLARTRFDVAPDGPIVLRLETFRDEDMARRAATPPSAVVRAAGQVWLFSLGVKGERSRGGRFVTEIGPVPALPRAAHYEMQVSEADFGPNEAPAVANAVHTHSGPEFWFVFTGEQCLETPAGITRARAGEGMSAPAETPMQLNIVGQSKRDAVFVVVHDASRPATTVSDWRPTGSCQR